MDGKNERECEKTRTESKEGYVDGPPCEEAGRGCEVNEPAAGKTGG